MPKPDAPKGHEPDVPGPYRDNAAQEATPPRAWREGEHLAVRAGKRIPSVCLKCGRTDGIRWRLQTFSAIQRRSPGRQVLLGALFGPLASAGRPLGPPATVEVPLCSGCDLRQVNRRIAGAVYLVVLIAFLVVCASMTGSFVERSTRWELSGVFVALIAGLFWMTAWVRASQVYALRVDGGAVVLGGVDPGARDAVVRRSSQKKAPRPAAAEPAGSNGEPA